MLFIDLNCDLGEGCATDKDVLPYMTSANVACGYHAGSPEIMRETVKLAKANCVAIGAHPGFPDRENFGRTEMVLPPEEIERIVADQVGLLKSICDEENEPLQHVKPHGALYNMAGKDLEMALAIASGIKSVDPGLIMLAPASGCLARAAEQTGLKLAREVFADRAYEEDGSLVSRKKPGAMVSDPELAIARVIRMVKEGRVETITGRDIEIAADSVCIHGDNPKAIDFAKRIGAALKDAGVVRKPLAFILRNR
jgi:UPF0271 protein